MTFSNSSIFQAFRSCFRTLSLPTRISLNKSFTLKHSHQFVPRSLDPPLSNKCFLFYKLFQTKRLDGWVTFKQVFYSIFTIRGTRSTKEEPHRATPQKQGKKPNIYGWYDKKKLHHMTVLPFQNAFRPHQKRLLMGIFL